MAIQNKDFIDINKPFQDVLKDVRELVTVSEKLSKVISEDLKKAVTDLSKNPTGKMQEQYEKTRQTLVNANKELRQNKEILKSLEKVERDHQKAIANKTAIESKEYRQVQELNEANRRRQKEIKTEIQLARVSKDSLAAKEITLRKLKQQYKEVGGAAARKMIPEIKKLDREVKKLNGSIGNSQGRVGSYFREFVRGAASMATMYLSFQGLTRLISNVTGIMIGFEKTMSGVKAITGATDDEMIKLSEDAKRLGSETNKTAQEVGQLQIEFGKLGFSTQEILDATEATVLLSQATGEDLASSAAVAGATVRGFGLEASETGRIVDVMAASFTSSALNLTRFSESMKYVAPVAKSVGISVEQTTAYLSKLADAGIHGSQAGTALRMVMLKMAQAGMTGAEGFAEMASKATGLAEANDEVGQRAATALLVMSEQSEELETLTEQYNNASGAAKEMAETQMDNLAGSIEILKSAWEGLVLKFTQGDGVIRRLVDSITSFVNWLKENSSAILTVGKVLLQLTAAWVSYNLILKISKISIFQNIAGLTALSIGQKATTLATTLATRAQQAFNTAIRANPIGLMVSALIILLPYLDSLLTKLQKNKKKFIDLRKEIDDFRNNMLSESEKRVKQLIKEGATETQAVARVLEWRKKQAAAYRVILKNMLENEDKYGKDSIETIQGNLEKVNEVILMLSAKKEEITKKITENLAKETIKQLEIERDLWDSRLKLQRASQGALLQNEAIYNRQIIEILRDTGQITEKEAETRYNNIEVKLKNHYDSLIEIHKEKNKEINNELAGMGREESGEEDVSNWFVSPDNQKTQIDEYVGLYTQFAGELSNILMQTNSKWTDLIQKFNQKISEQESIVSRAQEDALAGRANSYELEKKKLAELQAERDAATKKEEQNNIIRLRIMQSEKIENMGLAVSELMKNGASMGVVGVGASIISLTAMLAAVASAESEIQTLKKYKHGGLLEGASHENGGIKLVENGSVFAEAEGGEYVVNKKAYTDSPVITQMINEHKITDREVIPALNLQRQMRLLGIDENTSATRDLTNALLQGETVHGGRIIRRKGNNIIRRR